MDVNNLRSDPMEVGNKALSKWNKSECISWLSNRSFDHSGKLKDLKERIALHLASDDGPESDMHDND